ncbi:Hypothetical_protein [Hexamita inflata]|uniref:Hypothetical_protein n=1 Tax=Hexamita inflata TaxID=28002 RepID=A0AA86QC99_9EUKA|nr:Hypothetical protein HINF_LOCUS44076 [Hexamita inflata]
MSRQFSNTQKRHVLVASDKSEVDNHIIDLIHTQLAQQQIEIPRTKEGLVRWYLQNRTTLVKSRIINWYSIDDAIGMEHYKDKAYSYRRFVDVILANSLPEYPQYVQCQIQHFIKTRVKEDRTKLAGMDEREKSQYRLELEEIVKQEFSMHEIKEFSYKKQVDKNRNTIKCQLARCQQHITASQSRTSVVSQEQQDDFDLYYFTMFE